VSFEVRVVMRAFHAQVVSVDASARSSKTDTGS
jgi:hypothetical protein